MSKKTKKWTTERISSVLGGIQAKIPQSLINNVVREVKIAPVVEHVVDKLILDPETPEAKRQALIRLKEAGEFSKTKLVENKKIARMIDEFVSREINKAIRRGALPPRSQIGNLPHIKDIYGKVHQTRTGGETGSPAQGVGA